MWLLNLALKVVSQLPIWFMILLLLAFFFRDPVELVALTAVCESCCIATLFAGYIVCRLILFNVFYFQVEEKPTAFHFEVEEKLTAFSCHLCSAKYVHQQSLTKHLRQKHQVQRIIFIFSYSQHLTYAQSPAQPGVVGGLEGPVPRFFLSPQFHKNY